MKFLDRLFKREITEVPPAILFPGEEGYDRFEESFLFGPGPPSGSGYGPYYGNIDRDWSDVRKACQMRNCVRPSEFSIITLTKLDVDIFNARGDRMENQDRLPKYHFYELCDHHYEEHARGKPGVTYVTGPTHIFDPDKHAETLRKQRKLTKST